MKWTSTVETDSSLDVAVERAAATIFKDLDKREPDLVIAFISTEHAPQYESLPALLAREFESAFIFGCCGEGVIGAGQEVEDRPAIALTAAVLPGVTITGTHLEGSQVPPVYAERRLWEDKLRVNAADKPQFLILADPFSFDESFLHGLDRSFVQSRKIGGLASGAKQAGSTALYLGQRTHRSGIVTLALTGNIQIDPIVAQGCRPIGEPMFVTAVHENLIRELDGRMARDVLSDMFEHLPPEDRELFSESLSLGLATLPGRSQYEAGDFLVRSVLGMDPQSGALWVNGLVRDHSVVQFHVRDAATSAQDLERGLVDYRSQMDGIAPAAALLFSCHGRGANLYGQSDHDSNAFRRVVADVPIGGLFCNGEIGPVQNCTYVHSQTSAFGAIRPANKD
jgi:small ligand-binding sensory domain FIST